MIHLRELRIELYWLVLGYVIFARTDIQGVHPEFVEFAKVPFCRLASPSFP